MTLKRMTWFVLVLALIGAGAWWLTRPLIVEVAPPTRGEAVDAIYASGQIEPGVQMPIAPRNAGYVVAVLVREGDVVKRGQVLIRLQDDDLANGEAELAARADLARRQQLRAQDLLKQGFISQAEVDRTRTEHDAARAGLARSQSQRRFLQLTAPADGLILKRDVEVGQFVNMGQSLLYLSCCAPLRVAAEVDEEDIGRVRIGHPVLLRSDALGDAVLAAEVSAITPKGDPVSRSYRVRMKIAEPDRFRVGMTVDANIVLARRQQVLLLPRTAVNEQHVWLVRHGKLVRSKVVTGAATVEKIEIRSGIGAQDQVVIKPLGTFKPDQRVRATPAA
jgi:RND family efflux transporter MFP subunit